MQLRMIRVEKGSKGSKNGNSMSQPKDEGKCPRYKKKHLGKRCFVKCYGYDKCHIRRNCPKNKETPQVEYQGRIACYNYGQPGHISRECPKRQKMERTEGAITGLN